MLLFSIPKPKKAFSLVELMVSLIVISIVAAAFAPIVTKKMKSAKTAISQGQKITNECAVPECKLCIKDKCLICEKTCSGATYLDKNSCSCKPCTELDPNCTACASGVCSTCKAGFGISGGRCTKCAAGTVSSGSTTCQTCPAETYQPEAGKSNCLPCPGGFFCTGGANRTPCNPTFGQCTSCSTAGCSATGCQGGILQNGKCNPCPGGNFCVNGVAQSCNAFNMSMNCSACNASGCTTCGHGVISGGKCYACGYIFGDACKTCNQRGCTQCRDDYALKNGRCVPCRELYGDGCTHCNSTGCLTCPGDDRALKNGKCVSCIGLYGKRCEACNSEGCTRCISAQDIFVKPKGVCMPREELGGCAGFNNYGCSSCHESYNAYKDDDGVNYCVPNQGEIETCNAGDFESSSVFSCRNGVVYCEDAFEADKYCKTNHGGSGVRGIPKVKIEFLNEYIWANNLTTAGNRPYWIFVDRGSYRDDVVIENGRVIYGKSGSYVRCLR